MVRLKEANDLANPLHVAHVTRIAGLNVDSWPDPFQDHQCTVVHVRIRERCYVLLFVNNLHDVTCTINSQICQSGRGREALLPIR
jgi:hypothetical protein